MTAGPVVNRGQGQGMPVRRRSARLAGGVLLASSCVAEGSLDPRSVSRSPCFGVRSAAVRLVAKRVADIALIAVGIGTVFAGNPEYAPLRSWLGELLRPGNDELNRCRRAKYGFRWTREARWAVTDTEFPGHAAGQAGVDRIVADGRVV